MRSDNPPRLSTNRSARAFLLVDPDQLPKDWRGKGQLMAVIVLGLDELTTLLGRTTMIDPIPVEDELITMVLAGDTQGAIARRLGYSLRTVQRRLAHLRQDFGVRTTHELAVELARRGAR